MKGTSKGTKERIAELKAMLGNTRRLSSVQYRELLEEIQASAVIRLLENTLLGFGKDAGAYTMILEKVHWLLDSVKGTGASTGGTVIVKFLGSRDSDESTEEA